MSVIYLKNNKIMIFKSKNKINNIKNSSIEIIYKNHKIKIGLKIFIKYLVKNKKNIIE